MFFRCLIVAAAFALPACVSVLPDQEPPNALYRFGPMEPVHTMQTTVLVREPEASRLVGGRQIAAEDASGAIRYVPGVEWSEAATRMMQTAMLDRLGGQGSGAAVAAGAGVRGAYELTWRVSDFTLSGQTARCRIEATVLNGSGRTLVAQKTFSTRAEADGPRNADRAQALTEAGRMCVNDVAAFVAETANAPVPPIG